MIESQLRNHSELLPNSFLGELQKYPDLSFFSVYVPAIIYHVDTQTTNKSETKENLFSPSFC